MRAVSLYRSDPKSSLLRFLATVGLIAATAAPLHSQTLRGQVTDSVDTEPIGGLEVVLLNSQQDTVAVARTGNDGRFVLNVPEGEYTLYTRCLGRQPKWVTVNVPSDRPVMVRLAQAKNPLGDLF